MIQDKIDVRGHITSFANTDVCQTIYNSINDKDRFMKYRQQWYDAESMNVNYEFPLDLQLELVDGCNLKCKMCMRNNDSYLKSNKRLGFDTFKSIMDEASKYNLPTMLIGMGGEALLEPDIFKMLEYARSNGVIDLWFITNGTLLTEDLIDRIVELPVTRVSISIDAFSKATYKKIRGGDYDKLLSNINLLIDKKGDSPLPVIRVTCVELPENKEERNDFAEYWKDKVNKVDFQKVVDFSSDALLETVKPISCPSPFRSLSIWANGDVTPCCCFWGKDNLTVGNIYQNTLKEIWDSKGVKDLKESLISGKYKQACINCLG